MPTGQADIQKIEEMRQAAANKVSEAGALSGASSSFGDLVMNKVREGRAARGVDQLSKDMGTTTSELVTANPELRARNTDVNPLAVDALTAQQRGQTLGTLATTANIASQREVSLEDILNAGSNTLKTAAQVKLAEAESKKEEAESLFQMVKFQADQAQRAFENNLSIQKFNSTPSPGFNGLIGNTSTPTEPKPAYSATQDGQLSTGGQWQFSIESRDWVPVPQQAGEPTKEQLRQAAINDPENISKYKALNDFLYPDEDKVVGNDIQSQIDNLATSGERNAARAVVDKLQQIQDAKTLMETGVSTGPIAGRYSTFLTKRLNVPANDTVKLDKLLRGVFDTTRIESTGAAFSPQELEELRKYVAQSTNAQERDIEANLENALNLVRNKVRLYGLDPDMVTASGAQSSNDEWEIVQ